MMKQQQRVYFALAALLAHAAILVQAHADYPPTVNIQGQLFHSYGKAEAGNRAYQIRFYDAETEGAMIGTAVTGIAAVSPEGLFNLSVPIPDEALQQDALWYELSIDSDTSANGVDAADQFKKRVKVESVPWSFWAADVSNVQAGNIGLHTVNNAEFGVLDGILSDIQEQLAPKVDATALAEKADAAAVYSKTEWDTLQQAQDAAIAAKADPGAAYTRAETDAAQAAQDTAIGLKIDSANIHSKEEMDAIQAAQDLLLAAKANLSDTYTKTELDAMQAAQDAAIASKLVAPVDFYSKTEFDTVQSEQNTAAALKLSANGPSYVTAQATDDPVKNGENLLAAYAKAKTLTPFGRPLSATNRVVVFVAPGRYDLGSAQLTMDTEFIDLIGVSPVREHQYLLGTSNGPDTGVLCQTANNVRIENLYVTCSGLSDTLSGSPSDPAAYFPNTGLAATQIRNCEFRATTGNAAGMRLNIEYKGYYFNCTSDIFAFGYREIASGTFINCTAEAYSFGGYDGTASGTFIHCTAGYNSFGGGAATGTFVYCQGLDSSFGQIASGTFVHCTAQMSSFGNRKATGVFTNCIGGRYSFGGDDGQTLGGRFLACRLTSSPWNGTFRGRMERCEWYSIICGAEARLYNSRFAGLDLNNVAAGVAHCRIRGTIKNAGSASFNVGNLEDSDVN